MNCACGHHHPGNKTGCASDEGSAIALHQPMIALSGRLICADAAQMMTALSLLPDHMELSRAEAGCLRFDLWQDEDPLVWNLTELVADAQAFAAHQSRTTDSVWGRDSAGMARDFQRREVMPAIRPERPADQTAIDALHQIAFGGPDEATLVRALRDQGDLTLSLLAVAAGTVLGHVALSPLDADRPALALGPVAVLPKAQGMGIGAALVRAALGACGDRSLVVLGDPAFYRRFGFAPADLDSPYAGPHLQMLGDLPSGSRIRHASAFAAI
ncbi:GNAT family N-acetyltransferase [Paracoccus sp. (in: a-proteobacteria)]|uniref:GNAT family N-acetyltransferase n=1 Tax=Paracoccus sp. TaxID=267 RepID=UPI003A8B2311